MTVFNLNHKLKWFLANPKSFIVLGYLIACIWLTSTAAFAWRSFVTPVVLPSSIPTQTGIVSNVNICELIAEDVTSLRNPFSKIVVQGVVISKSAPLDPSGLRIKAIILSLKKGVVLEDVSGGVYFLSEGESVNGIKVNSITKTTVSVEVQGNKFDLSI